ncbi:MAG TPA: DUF4124 domain-containing protein [Thioalkalivibrio sp.]|nr:DUF4124 domain-containing protein [Thioalkalivibrio sp.]
MVTHARGRRLAPWALALAGVLGAAPALGTEIYRWVDQDGAVHFSDRPPQGRPMERIEVQPPMGALPLPDAEEILRRPVRPEREPDTTTEPEPAVEESGEVESEFLRDRRGRR